MTLCSAAMAAGVIGVFVLLKRLVFHRRLAFAACGPGFGYHGHHHHHGGWSRRWRGPGGSFWLRALFSRLDTTPGQEREIRSAIEEVQDVAKAARSSLESARGDLARAMTGDVFDDVAAAQASGRADAATTAVKDATTAALRKVHAVLDPKQRERLAELLEKGPGFRGRWGGGPYRA